MAAKISMKFFLLWACRLVVGGTFICAAGFKIADPSAFVTDIGHYHLLPYPLNIALGVYLPWLELLSGVSLLCRWRERSALILIIGMCGIFCLALASAWFRALDINCGCFGHSAAASSLLLAFVRSLVLGATALLLFKNLLQKK